MSRLMKYVFFLVFVSMALCLQYCATVNYQKSPADLQREITELQARLKNNPNDLEALRDLGVNYYETRQYLMARKILLQAFKRNPREPKTMTYLGFALEAEKKNKVALLVYKRYQKVPRLSPYRQTMAMRYRLLNRNMIQAEMRELLEREQTMNLAAVSPNSIAVFPLTYQGKDQKFSSLGLGLSEMMITDLSQVPGITIVERVRLQALFQEMALDQTGLVDESTAPRFGKLLGAAKIIHGNYDLPDADNLNLDVGYWDVLNNQTPEFAGQRDALDNLFKLEKDLVFNLITEMGIDLTPEVREKIQCIPTKNIQAFLAYCMGLEKEDGEQFEAAIKYYQLALRLDPQFSKAEQKVEEGRILLQADGTDLPTSPRADLKQGEASPQN